MALSGTSYAAYNSVGKGDIRANAVGKSEVREASVDKTEITDGGIDAVDLSDATRTALTDANAVTYRTAVTAAGAQAGGNAKSGTTIEPAEVGHITAEPAAEATKVTVRTFDAATPPVAADAPFHLLVAC